MVRIFQIYILFVQNLLLLQFLARGVLNRLIFQVILFVSGLFIAELSGPSLFGAISLMIVNAAIFMILSGFGTDAAIVWHASGKEISSAKSFTFAAGSGLVQVILFLLAQFIIMKTTGRTLLSNQEESYYFRAELIYFCGLVLTEKYTALYYGHHNATGANKFLSVISGFFLVVLFIIYISESLSIDPFMYFSVMTFGIGLGISILFHMNTGSFKLEGLSTQELNSLLRFSGIVFLTNAIQFLAYRLDFWLIDHFYGSRELGVYAQSVRFAQLLWVIPGILAGLMTPALRNKETTFSEKEFLLSSRLLTLISFIATFAIIGVSWLFYRYFFQEAYSPGWEALLLMIPGYFFFATTTLLSAWFSSKRMLIVNFTGSFICLSMIGIADILLIPRYSFRGAAMANSISYFLTTLYFVYIFLKKNPGNLGSLLLWKKEDQQFLGKLFSR